LDYAYFEDEEELEYIENDEDINDSGEEEDWEEEDWED